MCQPGTRTSQASSRAATSDPGWLAAAFTLLVASGCSSPEDGFDPKWPAFERERPPPSASDQALEFDGVAHYATVGTAGFPFWLAPQTIALWVKPAHLEGVQSFVVLRKDFQSGVQLGMQDGLLMAWRVFGGRTYVAAPDPLVADTWYHVAYVYDGSEHHLYVDGEERAIGDLEPNNRTSTTGWLGSRDGRTEFFAGSMDRVRIWSEARSAAQIVEDASGAGAGSSTGLVLDLPFDEPGGLRAYDHSGRDNHAALGAGFTEWAPRRVPVDSPLQQ